MPEERMIVISYVLEGDDVKLSKANFDRLLSHVKDRDIAFMTSVALKPRKPTVKMKRPYKKRKKVTPTE
jgi:hypothetical protein